MDDNKTSEPGVAETAMKQSFMQQVRSRIEAAFGGTDGRIDELVKHQDRWSNVYTGLNTTRDKNAQSTFSDSGPLSTETQRLLWSQSDLVHTICARPAQEMTREWIDLEVPNNQGIERDMLGLFEEQGLQSELCLAIATARYANGSALVLGADDRNNYEIKLPEFEDPLREERLRKLMWFQTYAGRSELDISKTESGATNGDFDRPEMYRVKQSQESPYTAQIPYDTKIHSSRVIRFRGEMTDRMSRRERLGWDVSTIELIYDVVRDFDAGFAAVARLLTDSSQSVFKIPNLANKLIGDSVGTVLTRLQLLDMYRSTIRAIPIDADEDFTRVDTPMSGIGDVLDRLMMRLSAATGIPVTVLMGRSPAGMNATGESDLRTWYAYIKGEQERILRPVLERIVYLTFISKYGPTFGVEPAEWSIHFKPLWTPNDKEKAETRAIQITNVDAELRMGTMDKKEARAELHPDKPPLPEDEEAVDSGVSFMDLRLSLRSAAEVQDLELLNAIRTKIAGQLGTSVAPMTEIPLVGGAAAAPALDTGGADLLNELPKKPPADDQVDERVDASVEEMANSLVARIEDNPVSDSIVSTVGQVIPSEGSAAMGALNSNKTFDVNTPAVDAYIAGVRERADRFDEHTVEVVRNAATRAVEANDESVLIESVAVRMDAAARLARDEAHKVINFVRTEAARQVGRTKTWNAILDSKTRPAHRSLHGQTIAAGAQFRANGSSAQGPGDFGDPALDSNCRCYVSFDGRTDDSLDAQRSLQADAESLEERTKARASELEPRIREAMERQLDRA